MVGCGGFGAANAGAAIMVRAAAKEPAIVAFAKTFLEFMEVILSREYRALRADRVIKTFTIGLPEDPATTRFRTTRCYEWHAARLLTAFSQNRDLRRVQ